MKEDAQQALWSDAATASGRTDEDALHVLASNYSLPALLARGCLLPPGCGEETGVGFLDEFPHTLLCARGALAVSWCEAIERTARNAFPVALRLNRDGIRTIGSQFSVPAVTIRDVATVVFRTEDERDLFLSLPFADFSLEELGLPIAVAPEVFLGSEPKAGSAISEASPLEGEEEVPRIPSGDLSRALRAADAIGALIVVYAREAPAERDWMQRLGLPSPGATAPVSSTLGPQKWFSSILASIDDAAPFAPADLDDVLINATVRVLLARPPSDGWPSREVLQEIFEIVSGSDLVTGDEAARDALTSWYRKCCAVLAADAEPPMLTDQGSLPRRAILLLLLRGEIPALMDSSAGTASALRIGKGVRTLAMSLAAVRTGFRGLPKEYKIGPSHPRHSTGWLSFTGELVVRRLDGALGGEGGDGPTMTVEYHRRKVLDGDWVINSGDWELLRRPASIDPNLQALVSRATSAGYTAAETKDGALSVVVPVREGRSVNVCLEVRESPGGDGNFARFFCTVPAGEVQDERGRGKKRGIKISKLRKADLMSLLSRNASADLQCRIGYRQDEDSLVVISDQLFSTFDEAEFRWHAGNVAKLATTLTEEFFG